MRSVARAVVIGGGVVGVSTLYHLARKGWSDVVLVERRDLTSGSTWHAAGLLPLFNLSYAVGQIHKYSLALYKTLEAETNQNVGFKQVSNIRIARTPERWDEYLYYKGVAETIGVQVKVLTPAQLKDIWPLCQTDGLVGAIQHPDDGYIQPADLTQALAKGARSRGAEICRNTTVVGIERKAGQWLVKTDKGDIACEHVVAASGNFARRTGAMVGLDVPVIPVEHQYIVTAPHPAIVERAGLACLKWAFCARPTAPGTCGRRTVAYFLGPTRAVHPAVTSTVLPTTANTNCSRRISTALRHISRPRSHAFQHLAKSGSKRSTMEPFRTHPTARPLSALPGTYLISG